ncbi:hypothetical protein, partial [Micromonospora sp. 4G55]|uniref:hypothetical protein n=1 Tax=Micromonospora sp. 4G55 TaxID=2806102 RepID=UPI001A3CD922
MTARLTAPLSMAVVTTSRKACAVRWKATVPSFVAPARICPATRRAASASLSGQSAAASLV